MPKLTLVIERADGQSQSVAIKPLVGQVLTQEEQDALIPEAAIQSIREGNEDLLMRKAMNDIRSQSSILREMEDKGSIEIAGGIYDMDTGEVEFLY